MLHEYTCSLWCPDWLFQQPQGPQYLQLASGTSLKSFSPSLRGYFLLQRQFETFHLQSHATGVQEVGVPFHLLLPLKTRRIFEKAETFRLSFCPLTVFFPLNDASSYPLIYILTIEIKA
jgi:hypothetical protein